MYLCAHCEFPLKENDIYCPSCGMPQALFDTTKNIDKNFDLAALGELLIDFTPAGTARSGHPLYEQNPGGAPANVLAAFCKLGGTGCFIGTVGEDSFGHFLETTLIKNNISTNGLCFTKEAATTLAFVYLNDNGDRSFSFCRSPGADLLLTEKDIDFTIIDRCRIFHFGSLSLTDEPARSATFAAVQHAKDKGKLISFDPNWRPLLWKSKEEAVRLMKQGLFYADIVKVSEEELQILSGCSSIEEGCKMIFKNGVKLIVVTLGPEGCYYHHACGYGQLATYSVNTVDTTGAGDIFLGALLWHFNEADKPITDLCKEELEGMLRFANAAGALSTTKKGAIPSIPTKESILDIL